MTRVLTFLHSFEPGGVERDALRLAADWERRGLDVKVVLGRREGALGVEAPALDYEVLQRGQRSTAAFETLFMIARLPAVVRRWRPDVIFCAGNTYTIVAVMLRLLLGAACPPIVLKISNDLERRDLPWVARKAFHLWLRVQARAFARIVAMTDAALAEARVRMAPAADRMVMIWNASLTDADFRRFGAARDAAALERARRKGRLYLSIGRLVRQKNQALMIDAFARIARPDDQLVILGEGPYRARLEAQVKRLGLSEQVRMPGHSQALAEALAAADAFLLPSYYEGLGVVVVEALAAGVPVVATHSCVSMPALVGGGGMVAPNGDVEAFARGMEWACHIRPDVATMRERASRFTVEATSGAWLRLLAEVACERRRAPGAAGRQPIEYPA